MREQHMAMVGRGFKAFQQGDLDAVRELNDEKMVWRTPGIGPFKSEYRGPNGVIEYLTQLLDLSEGTIKVEPEHMYADEDRVVVLEHVTASRGGMHVDFHDVLVYEFDDGKFRSITQYELDEEKLEKFWS